MIYKFPLRLAEFQRIGPASWVKFLCVQLQAGVPCIWAQVDIESADAKNINAKVWIFGTGNELPPDFRGDYLGTFQQNQFVWHVYTEL